jgi:hypothetical protein
MILFENDIYPKELFVSYFVVEKTREEASNITIQKLQSRLLALGSYYRIEFNNP